MFDLDQSAAATVPDDVAELLDALRARLTDLADRQPLAALTAAGHLKATEEEASVRAADTVLRMGGSWAKVGAALGVTKQAAHQRLARRIAARGAAVRASLPPGEREKQRSAATPRAAEPAVTAAPAPAGSAQLAVIKEPDDVLVGEIVRPDDLDSGPESRIRRLLLAYQESPAREYPYATCPTCHLTGPPGSISALRHPDGTIDWTTPPRVRCHFCSAHHHLDHADVPPPDATTTCSRCAVAIHHPVGASRIECPCCHLFAPGPADENPDPYERRRLAETGNIRRLQSRLQDAKDRNPELAAHLAGPIRTDSVRLDVPTAGGRRLGSGTRP